MRKGNLANPYIHCRVKNLSKVGLLLLMDGRSYRNARGWAYLHGRTSTDTDQHDTEQN